MAKQIRKSQLLVADLPKLEITVHYFVFVSSLLYILYCAYVESEKRSGQHKHLVEGWSYLDRPKDFCLGISLLSVTIFDRSFYMIIHCAIIKAVKLANIKWLPYAYVIESLSILLMMSSKITALIIMQCLLNFLLILTGSKRLLWIYNLLFTIIYQHYNKAVGQWSGLRYSFYLAFYFTHLTNVMKGLSFGLDLMTCGKVSIRNFVPYMAYMFYWPNMMFGPVILYEDFEKTYRNQSNANLVDLGLRMAKFYCCYCVLEIMSHYIFKSMIYYLPYFEGVPYSAVIGFHFWQSIDFNMKLMIFHGTAIHTARAEGISVADVPGCIFRMTRLSQMWKHLDGGTHSFRVRYIYKPLLKIGNRHVAALFPFAYMVVWHGPSKKMLLWAVLNYIEYKIEEAATLIGNSDFYKRKIKTLFAANTERRILALLKVPLLIFSLLLNFIFLSNVTSVQYLVGRFLKQSAPSIVIQFCVAYSWCILSDEVSRRQDKSIKKHLDVF